MSKTLHILNGDSTLHLFQASNIEGDTFVWREVLSDGPVPIDFASDQFWKVRESFMTLAFKLDEENYAKNLIDPFKALEKSLTTYEEIVLWFEYDLFCQINMIALIQWLGKQRLETAVSLICTGKINDSDRLFALGEISPEQYPQLFSSRLKLGSREFDYCSDVYEAYCSEDPNDLFTYVLMSLSEFPYLADALRVHFKRFPFHSSGLSEIEQKLIDLIQEGENDKMKLVGKMLRWQQFHGFGDAQYFNILEGMKPLFDNFDQLKLSTKLDKGSVEELLNRDQKLGGAKLSDWYWDEQEKTLIPKESAS